MSKVFQDLVKIFWLAFLLTALLMTPLSGQAGSNLFNITWSKEEILAKIGEIQKQSYYPVIAADSFGCVHVFWTQGNAIYYRYKEGLGWSLPIDVVWSKSSSITFPSVAIDQDGILHLAWYSYGEIRYKSVPAWEAGNVHRWSAEKTLVFSGGSSTPLRLAVDGQNRLHIVFADWIGKPGLTEPGNVYHIFSEDGGKTWSGLTKISLISKRQLATDPRIAFDKQDRAHIVWGLMDLNQDGVEVGVFYRQIDKDGNLLSLPVEIAHRLPSDRGMMRINIAIRDEEVHLIWVCGEKQAQRCQTWSADGGETWFPYQRVFKELIGLSGWDALVVDGSENLIWLTVLRYPQAMYYSTWDGRNWVDPPLIASTDSIMKLGENIMAVVGMGNQVHVVVQLGDTIAYMAGKTPAMRRLPQPKPESRITPTEAVLVDTPVSSETDKVSPMVTKTLGSAQHKAAGISERNIFLISSISVIVLIFVVAMIKKYFRL